MVDDMIIDFWLSWNFTSMENVRKECNPMVDLLKFTSNEEISNNVILLKIILSVT